MAALPRYVIELVSLYFRFMDAYTIPARRSLISADTLTAKSLISRYIQNLAAQLGIIGSGHAYRL